MKISGALNPLRTILNKLAIIHASNKVARLRFENNPFFIVAIPGSLCEVALCLQYIPDEQPVYLIANGLARWEFAWIKKNLKCDGIIPVLRTLPHGYIIDLLLDVIDQPFGIIDYDCFIFDPSIFTRLHQLTDTTLLNAVFGQKNRKLDLDFPETFAMFFNTKVINGIRRKYRINSSLTYYDSLPISIKQKLSTIGIDESHQPEDFKNYIDTAKLWISLDLAEGYKINFFERQYTLTKDFRKVFHVGAGNKTDRLNSIWNVRGTYFWRRALETCRDTSIQSKYYKKYGTLKSSEIPTIVPDLCEQIGKEFFEVVEKVVNHV